MSASISITPSEETRKYQEVFTVPEAAEFLRISEKTIRRVIDAGSLLCSRIGKRVVITRNDIMLFLAQCKQDRPHPKNARRKTVSSG